MEVNISNSQKESNNSNIINNNNKEKRTINITISENYQGFISVIYFIIGCSFLYYLFSFVFSVYVSINIIIILKQYNICLFLFTCIAVAELYLSLAYFYFKKFQLKNLYGPNQLSLIGLQLIGIIFIGINYYINNYISDNESFIFYKDNQKYYCFVYLFSEIFAIFLFVLTTIIILVRKRKGQLYNVLNESKN